MNDDYLFYDLILINNNNNNNNSEVLLGANIHMMRPSYVLVYFEMVFQLHILMLL